MKNVWTIAWRDLKANFTSPVAYVILSLYVGIMSWMFFFTLSAFHRQNTAAYHGESITITDHIIKPLYGNMNVILLFFVPFITMRSFAEERKNHTIELLMTSPITVPQMVLGKALSGFLFVLIMMAITSIYPLVLFLTGNPDPGSVLTAILGTFMLACCYVSMGVFFSSMTENQIVAVALSFVGGLFFWLIGWAAMAAGPVMGDVLQYFSLINHFKDFSRGTLNSSDIVYYFSFIGLGLFLTYRVLESYRWR